MARSLRLAKLLLLATALMAATAAGAALNANGGEVQTDSSALSTTATTASPFTFAISGDGKTFLLDGKPHRIMSAEFHYFRCPAGEWEERLLTIKATRAINTISTYVPWNFHCPNAAGDCDFTGDRDVRAFVQLCQRHGFEVVLRPGPYICAEWEFGGLPAWLTAEDASIPLRSSDPRYIAYVDAWYGALLPPLRDLMCDRGGPIVMVQIENEYGAYTLKPDRKYLAHLRDLTRQHVGAGVVLYATDPQVSILLSVTGGVFQAIDFLYWGNTERNVSYWWEQQRLAETVTNSLGERSLRGPPMNGEFYPGWFSSWGDKWVLSHTTQYVSEMVDDMMVNTSAHSNLNFFMFFGGTNFGFWSGSAVTTSYDYGAPMNESGHPTQKFFALRDEVFPRITGLNTKPEHKTAVLPKIAPPTDYGTVRFGAGNDDEAVVELRTAFSTLAAKTVMSNKKPLSMEAMGHPYGYISYELQLPWPPEGKSEDAFYMLNNITVLAHDYAMLFVDDDFVGHLRTFDGIGNYTVSGLADGVQLSDAIAMREAKRRRRRGKKDKKDGSGKKKNKKDKRKKAHGDSEDEGDHGDLRCHSTLRIVVENTGRMNNPLPGQQMWKGIRDDVIFTFVDLNDRSAPLVDVPSWTVDVTSLPMRYEDVSKLFAVNSEDDEDEETSSGGDKRKHGNKKDGKGKKKHGKKDKKKKQKDGEEDEEHSSVSTCASVKSPDNPLSAGFFVRGTINIPKVTGPTLLDMRGHGKGFVFVNGHNVGRYWSILGPQYSLFVPRSYLKEGENEIILFEQARPFSMAAKHLAKNVPPITLSSQNFNVRRDTDEGAARDRRGLL